jgi:hypothetical protein
MQNGSEKFPSDNVQSTGQFLSTNKQIIPKPLSLKVL